MTNQENPLAGSRAVGDSKAQLLTLIESDLTLTRTFIEIERSTRISGSLRHADQTRERVLKAFEGVTALIDKAESLHLDVASQRHILQTLESEWKSGS